MENKKRYLLIILGIVLISILGTFAWLTWKSKDTSLVLTIGDISGTTVTLKPYMIEQSLIPTLTYEGNESINVTAKNNGTTENDIVLYYKINDISNELITDSFKYTILKSIDNGETYEEYQTGNFASSVSGEEYVIMTETIPENTTYNYRVYTWLDGENETSSNIQGKSFKAELRASIFNGSVVTVDIPSGLIPVTIANDGTVTSILETDSSWYDYNNKLWANGVLVTESSRNSYLNTMGVTIPEDDILAYYVYIPRYKYKIWTTGTSSASNEQEIEILFENIDIPKSKGTRVGEYRTHPGFTFGSDELNGIWVGKFETTGANNRPTVKPNTTALVNQDIATQFQTSLKFAGGVLNNGTTTFSGSNVYGLNIDSNSHMSKNTEWSAATYLSHSKYGINEEIRINNYYNNEMKTGCGASTANASQSTTCEISYGASSTYPQSTTGNITGVFDMSGGFWDRTMGVFANSSGTLWSGNSTTENSGFNGLLGTGGTSYTSGIDFPEEKYYNVYKASGGTTINPLTSCNNDYCYGHGLSEVSGWYGDYDEFVFSTSTAGSWFVLSGGYRNKSAAGAFYFNSNHGHAIADVTFRSIIIAYPKNKNATVNNINLSIDLNGGTSSQSFKETYQSNEVLNLTNPTRLGYTFDGWEITTGDGKILTNLIKNGSFENGSNEWIKSGTITFTVNSNKKIYGNNSLYGEFNKVQTDNQQSYQIVQTVAGHKYYFTAHTFHNVASSNTLCRISFSPYDSWTWLAYTNTGPMNTWVRHSLIYDNPSYSYLKARVALGANSAGTTIGDNYYIDGVMVIDLTKSYGAGNEPTKEWLDNNIDYFDDSLLYLGTEDITIKAKWRTSRVYINFNVNGGTITKNTTNSSNGNSYIWTTDNTGNIYKSLNGGQSTKDYLYYNYNATSTQDLPNWDNSGYMQITKSGYTAKSGAEWICSSGCSSSYSDDIKYSASDFCDATNGDCTVVLKVNWEKN